LAVRARCCARSIREFAMTAPSVLIRD
jgi:hypothetical protein